MLTGLWTVGIKVPDLEAGVAAFQQQMGSNTILDDTIVFEGESFRIPLLRMGDKYVHIAERMVYEKTLPQPLPYGIVHLVYISDAIERDLERATRSVATCFIDEVIHPLIFRHAAGVFQSPSGYIFEIIEILENRVPAV